MYQIKQSSTAYPLVFLMVQTADHITGLTGAAPTVTISKAGAAFGAVAGAVTEISSGWYKVAGNATDTGTLGPLALHATAASGDPTDMMMEVVAYDPQDAVRLGLTALPNAAAEASGGLYTRGTGAGQINQDANGRVDANAKAWIGGTIPAVNVTGVPKVDIVDWLGAAPDALSSGKIPADLKLWLTVAPLALSSQMVQAIVADYAAGKVPLQPTTPGNTLDVSATGEAGLDFNNIKDATGSHTLTNITVPTVTTTATATALTTNNDKTGYALSSGGVQAIWDALTSALTTVGSIGKRLADDVDATISSRSSHSAADVWAATTRTLSTAGVQAIWDALTSALTTSGSIGKLLVDNINATISSRLASASYTTPPTVGAIADQVWDEVLSGHAGVGSAGAALTAAGSAGDPWATPLPGAYGAGTAGELVGTNLDDTISSRAAPGDVMQTDLTQALDLTPTTETVGDALLAARAQGFGKWTLVSTTLTLYANDGTTPLRVFTLDSATTPTSRT